MQLEGHPTKYWHKLDDGRVQCDLCPRYCRLREGQRGLCFVRGRAANEIVLTTYGRSSGFCVDPVEKKPLNHFLPGTPVLSFGTAGCNLACKFCQNWDMTRSRDLDLLQEHAPPRDIAAAAARTGSRSVAYTYNDPVIFLEYVVDTAIACRELEIRNIAVTAGYTTDAARQDLFRYIDATNIDLKAFTDRFYWKICGAHLGPVLDTILYVKHETDTWLELTTLLVPGENDDDEEIDTMTRWIFDELGPDVPLHFSAFHPDWKMLDKAPTPMLTLRRARKIALGNGLHHVYTGNVHDPEGSSTWCHHCGELLIGRSTYDLSTWNLRSSGRGTVCAACGTTIAGVFDQQPGTWGSRRQPVRIAGSRGAAQARMSS